MTSLLEENGIIKGVQYKTKVGQELKAYAPLTIVCDGCFSNLRCSLCDPKVTCYANLHKSPKSFYIASVKGEKLSNVFFFFLYDLVLVVRFCPMLSTGKLAIMSPI